MKPTFTELLFASFKYEDYNPKHTKVLILNAMFFITIVINLLFMLINLFITQTYTLFFVNLFMFLLICYALYLLREEQKYTLASIIGILTLFTVFILVTLIKHGDKYSLIWTYFFVPYAIITMGAKRGFVISLIFISIILAICYTGINIWDEGRWDSETLFRISLAHFIMLYVIYAIQNSNEKANEKIEALREKEKIQLQLLEKLSITDTLTGLYNRRFFEEIFPRQIKRAHNQKLLLTFFTLDLDYFKQYNDTYGHQQGDLVLVQIADILKEVFNKSDDYTFRMGGEEFSGLFLDHDIDYIHAMIARIATTLKERNIEHKGNPKESVLTCSIGVYVQKPDSTLNHQEIYRLADEAMYQAKNNGRDQIVYV